MVHTDEGEEDEAEMFMDTNAYVQRALLAWHPKEVHEAAGAAVTVMQQNDSQNGLGEALAQPQAEPHPTPAARQHITANWVVGRRRYRRRRATDTSITATENASQQRPEPVVGLKTRALFRYASWVFF